MYLKTIGLYNTFCSRRKYSIKQHWAIFIVFYRIYFLRRKILKYVSKICETNRDFQFRCVLVIYLNTLLVGIMSI